MYQYVFIGVLRSNLYS